MYICYWLCNSSQKIGTRKLSRPHYYILNCALPLSYSHHATGGKTRTCDHRLKRLCYNWLICCVGLYKNGPPWSRTRYAKGGWFTVNCSTVEPETQLTRHRGIEPLFEEWKSSVLTTRRMPHVFITLSVNLLIKNSQYSCPSVTDELFMSTPLGIWTQLTDFRDRRPKPLDEWSNGE